MKEQELDSVIELDPAYIAWKSKLLQLKKENEAMRSYFEKIIDAAPGHLYWKNKEGVYLGCNLFMVHFYHFDSKIAIIGKTDEELWPHCAKALRDNDRRVMETGETLIFEENVHGSINRSVKMPLRDENEGVIGVIGNSVDISDLKKIQRELIEAREIAEAARTLSKKPFSFFKPTKIRT
jgi:two-component system, OmpR family, aerobic respiration control sensor histidine kinase ArcB